MNPQSPLPNLLFSLALNYIRWTQLTPMLMVWGFGVLLLLAMTFVNFQETSFSVLGWLMQMPFLGEPLSQWLSDDGGQGRMTTADFKSFVLSTWTAASLAFMLASMLISALFGPFRPWTLKRKFLLTGAAAIVLTAGMIFNFIAAPGNFNGGFAGWVLNFSLISLVVFLVSAYSLTISHLLLKLDKALFGNTPDPRAPEMGQ